MNSFWQFLNLMEHERTKLGLYPWGYDGIGNYPPADIVARSADAIYYLDVDERLSSWWDGPPFDITHIPSTRDIKEPKPHNMPGKECPHCNKKPEGLVEPKYKMPPGDVVPPTQWVDLVTNPKLLDPKKNISC